jgi:hypothetical protein
MLEQARTKKNQPALKWQGRWLSSSVDAVAEAAAWLRQQDLRPAESSPIIVIGVGSGYHLIALVEAFPGRQIVAIDFSQQIIDSAQSGQGLGLANVKFVCADNTGELQNSIILQQAMRSSYSLLLYAPATVPNPKFYSEIQMYLSGRSESGLRFLLGIREQLAQDLGENTIHATTNEPISIKTLIARITKNCSPETKLIFMSLRELVD